jgi:hypothetical protein
MKTYEDGIDGEDETLMKMGFERMENFLSIKFF